MKPCQRCRKSYKLPDLYACCACKQSVCVACLDPILSSGCRTCVIIARGNQIKNRLRARMSRSRV